MLFATLRRSVMIVSTGTLDATHSRSRLPTWPQSVLQSYTINFVCCIQISLHIAVAKCAVRCDNFGSVQLLAVVEWTQSVS